MDRNSGLAFDLEHRNAYGQRRLGLWRDCRRRIRWRRIRNGRRERNEKRARWERHRRDAREAGLLLEVIVDELVGGARDGAGDLCGSRRRGIR
jgi:hypothetical protein